MIANAASTVVPPRPRRGLETHLEFFTVSLKLYRMKCEALSEMADASFPGMMALEC